MFIFKPGIFKKKKLEVSSTSKMLKGMVFNGREIKEVLKTSESGRLIRFTDGTSQVADKDELIALARVKGAMMGEQKSKFMTPWERKQRMRVGLKIKESQITKSKEGKARYIKIRNLSGKLAKNVQGAPEVRFEKIKGVKVPVVAHYYSRQKPDTKATLLDVKKQHGVRAYNRLKHLLRQTGNLNKAMTQLQEEMK